MNKAARLPYGAAIWRIGKNDLLFYYHQHKHTLIVSLTHPSLFVDIKRSTASMVCDNAATTYTISHMYHVNLKHANCLSLIRFINDACY